MLLYQCLVLLAIVQISVLQNIEINTPLGKIQGSRLISRLGKTIYSFRGIRYAQAPINELRFQPPVATGNWSGVYNATVDTPACPQPQISGLNIPLSEDCLFLNVYTPEIQKNRKYPVIIFLHGGAFYIGTGRSDITGPQYLLDHDVILVTLNYRLGALGFLRLGSKIFGNMGLKDQVLAMKWVQKNIKAFGGDPKSVTLYGYSAGACCISLHLVSPMSRRLFHKAIISSCAMLGPIPRGEDSYSLAQKQARFLGCPDDNPEKILNCLKSKSAQEIADTLPKFLEFGINPILIWSPVIEKDFGQKRFLVEKPSRSVRNDNFHKVPVLAGVTKDEFANLAFNFGNAALLRELNDHFDKYAPICFAYERNTVRSIAISSTVRQFYLGYGPLNNVSIPGIGKIYADSLTGWPVNRAVNLISKYSYNKVFYYEFTYTAQNDTNGVYHGDDSIYLIYPSALFPLNSSVPSAEMIDTMTLLWTNFAKIGYPTLSSTTKLNQIEWKPYNIITKKYLDIGKTLVMKKDLYPKRYAFWNFIADTYYHD